MNKNHALRSLSLADQATISRLRQNPGPMSGLTQEFILGIHDDLEPETKEKPKRPPPGERNLVQTEFEP